MTAPRPEIVACLFAHEMMRRLGIASDDIFIDTRLEPFVGITVRVAGKEWVWTLRRLPVPAKAFIAEWQEAVAWWNGASQEEIDELGMDRSPEMAQAAQVIQSLLLKGIPLDPLADARSVEQRRKAAN